MVVIWSPESVAGAQSVTLPEQEPPPPLLLVAPELPPLLEVPPPPLLAPEELPLSVLEQAKTSEVETTTVKRQRACFKGPSFGKREPSALAERDGRSLPPL
jgi:hypothetical protein